MIKGNNIITKDNHAKIEIKSKKYGLFHALIDLEDIERIEGYTWYVCLNKYTNSFYVINSKYKLILHNLIMNTPKGMQVDHIYHNTLDNRKDNLRICTNKQNKENQLTCQFNNKSSSIRGVTWNKQNKKWQAQISHNKKYIYGGLFDSLECAELKAIELRNKYFTHSLI